MRLFGHVSYTDSATVAGCRILRECGRDTRLGLRRLRETWLRLKRGKADDVSGVAEEGEGVREMELLESSSRMQSFHS